MKRLQFLEKNKCDGIIAIGGGSAIDTAKGVNIVVSEDTDDLMQFVGAERIKKTFKTICCYSNNIRYRIRSNISSCYIQ